MEQLLHIFDLFLYAVLAVVWLSAGLLIIARHLEKQGLRYDIERIPEGIKFWYRLGVYAGDVKLQRVADQESVSINKTVFGWICKFPANFTNEQMCKYIASHLPCMTSGGSHTKDLGVFNEIVNNRNTFLTSINGAIYVYEERRKQDNRLQAAMA